MASALMADAFRSVIEPDPVRAADRHPVMPVMTMLNGDGQPGDRSFAQARRADPDGIRLHGIERRLDRPPNCTAYDIYGRRLHPPALLHGGYLQRADLPRI